MAVSGSRDYGSFLLVIALATLSLLLPVGVAFFDVGVDAKTSVCVPGLAIDANALGVVM